MGNNISDIPELLQMWHAAKNDALNPENISRYSKKPVWWLFPYDDPEYGHFDFEWESAPTNTKPGCCPFLTGHKVWTGFNDLATHFPEIAKEWHPTKNGDLTPDKISYSSHDKVWWFLPYDDPESGSHFDFEWEATVYSRTNGSGCPYLKGKAVWRGFNDLETLDPDLAKEWHPTKNQLLSASDITVNSNKVVWWYLPYDDPASGKHFDFEWQASVNSRRMNGCPFLSGRKVWSGFNDLQTMFPDIADEWNYEKNGALKPSEVTFGSGKNVWWKYPYHDPLTGKDFIFEWEATVNQRTGSDSSCPVLSGQMVWEGYNDLETVNPELATEWHPTKNGDLTPKDVTPFSQKKVWWILPYDDPVKNTHFDFEWEATIALRSSGHGCPYLSGQAVFTGYNDLASNFPEIAKEWHPTKNGNLTPDKVLAFSNDKVWWLLHYKEPTGKKWVFEWEMEISSRTYRGQNCPYLCGKMVMPGFNDLASFNPSIAAEWHPTKNGSLTPQEVTPFSNRAVWWYLPYDDPISGKHFDFEWKAVISSRVSDDLGCPYLSNKAVWIGFNDIKTTYPVLAEQWHPTKNGNKKPEDYTYGSQEHVWWYLPYYDINTGKTFGFEWQADILSRTKGENGCPYLSNKAVWVGFNDLRTTHPALAEQWHPTKNGNRKPEDFTYGSRELVWWYLKYSDEESGKSFEFEWPCRVEDRTIKGVGCPYLTNYAFQSGFNDLCTTHPDLAKQWHPTKNGLLTPAQVSARSDVVVWWYLPFDDPNTGKHFDFEWKTSLYNRVINGSGCPFLSNREVWQGFNDLKTTHPAIAAEWHPTKNGDLFPEQVTFGSNLVVWWFLPYDDERTGKHFDFEWQASINYRTTTGYKCPYICGSKIWSGYNDLQSAYPEIAAQWHPTKNGDLTPDQIYYNSSLVVWWLLPYDDERTGKHFDFEWQAPINYRTTAGYNCPYVFGSKVWSGYNDLQTVYPEIAAQWHPTKNGDLTPDKVFYRSTLEAWWLISYDVPETGMHHDFEWHSMISARTVDGYGCPYLEDRDIWPGYNDLSTLFPYLIGEWDFDKNIRINPNKISPTATDKVWWKCSEGHEWFSSIYSRTKLGSGCPECRKLNRGIFYN